MQGEGKGLERETNLEDSPFAIRRKKKVVVESNFGEKESFFSSCCMSVSGGFRRESFVLFFPERASRDIPGTERKFNESYCILGVISSKKE